MRSDFEDSTIRSKQLRAATRKSWLVYLLALLTCFVAGLIVYQFDVQIANWLRRVGELPGDARRVLALSELVAHGTGILIILSFIWCISPHLRLHLPRVAACGFMAGLIANAVKLLHARIRPAFCSHKIDTAAESWEGWWPTWDTASVTQYDYAMQSFPSAHTATAFGFAIGVSWLYPRGRYLFWAMAMLAGLQRAVSLAHWPSDVLFGASLGILLGACFVLPGTIGNGIFNWLEWRFGMRRDLKPLSIPIETSQTQDEQPQRHVA